jgi:hypothetical protein
VIGDDRFGRVNDRHDSREIEPLVTLNVEHWRKGFRQFERRVGLFEGALNRNWEGRNVSSRAAGKQTREAAS